MLRTTETDSAAATEQFGASLVELLEEGDVVLVSGELGAGKTTVIRGACRALGVEVPVTSPTFALANRYPARPGLSVSHIDLYRLDSFGPEEDELLADYVGAGRIAFVEWPRGDAAALGPVRLRITLEHLGGDRRRIELAP